MNQKNRLQAENISKYFVQGTDKIKVLSNISILFESGVRYAITGASGSGKSTLLHLLAGLEIPNSGSLLFNGQNINHMAIVEKNIFLRKSIGLVFQKPYLIRELSVLENIILPGLLDEKDRKQAISHAYTLLEHMHLADTAQRLPGTLSGGQQQRIALARALFNTPHFLLADEPTGNLDQQTGKQIVDLMLTYSKNNNIVLIICTHDPYVSSKMDIVYHLHNGTLVEKR